MEVTRDCSGLIGEYFSTIDFNGDSLLEVRIDSTVDYQWAVNSGLSTIYSSPPFLPSGAYSVRWTGFLRSASAGGYQLRTKSKSGARVWIGEELILDDWASDDLSDFTGEVTLEANTFYPVRVEFKNVSGGESEMRWFWTVPDGIEEIVPAERLFYCEEQRPRVRITEPFDREQVPGAGPIFLSAVAESFSGTIKSVEFFADGKLISTSPYVPGFDFSGFWNGASEGSHVIMARAIDDQGATMDSIPHTIEVKGDLSGCLNAAYRQDFEQAVGVDEWSDQRRSATPIGGRQFLGPFGGALPVQLSLTDLAEHTAIEIELDLYVLRSWEGDGSVVSERDKESWKVQLGDGSGVFEYSFSAPGSVDSAIQSYPDLIGEGAGHPPGFQASEINTLGYYYGLDDANTSEMDAVYHIRLEEIVHSDSDLNLFFSGKNFRGVADESWGIDNVVVKTLENSAPPKIIGSLEDQSVIVGALARFEVQVDSPARTSYQWRKDGVVIPGQTDRLLVLQDVGQDDGGSYSVLVSNCSGDASSLASLSVELPNQSPRLIDLPSDISLKEDGEAVRFPFEISDAEDVAENLVVELGFESGTALIAGDVSIIGDGASRELMISPRANVYGLTVISVQLTDSEGLSTRQLVSIQVIPENDPPVIGGIDDLVAFEGEVLPRVLLNDIGSGAFNENDELTISVETSNPELFARVETLYTSPSIAGELTLIPNPGERGQSVVTVTVDDGGSENNLRTVAFTVMIERRPNILPNIVLTTGQQGDVLTTDDELDLLFLASDEDGEVLSVSLIQDGELLSVVEQAPFEFAWQAPGEGSFELRGVAIDDREGRSLSDVLSLTVVKANEAPVLAPIGPLVLDEDAGLLSISIDIQDDKTPVDQLEWDLEVLDGTLLADVKTVFSRESKEWQLELLLAPDQFGETSIRIRATDSEALFSEEFVPVTVSSVNDLPTLGPISNVVFFGGSITEIVPLDGISTGASNEEQTLLVSAVSSLSELLPDPEIVYSSPDATGTLLLKPKDGQFGDVEIVVTVSDSEDMNGEVSVPFNVKIEQRPNVLPSVGLLQPMAGLRVTEGDLVGVTLEASDSDGQVSEVFLLVNGIELASKSEAPFVFDWRPQAIGIQTLQGRVIDDRGGVGFSDAVAVTVLKRNQPPSLAEIPSVVVKEDSGEKRVRLEVEDDITAVSDLTVTGEVLDSGFLVSDRVNLVQQGGEWELSILPAPDAFGVATIQVAVIDGAQLSVVQEFVLVIEPVNDPPTLGKLNNLTLQENGSEEIVELSGISLGAQNETGALVVTVSSSNLSVVGLPDVEYSSPDSTGRLRVTPAPNGIGFSDVSVTVSDGEIVGGFTSRTFRVFVEEVPNLPPTVFLTHPKLGDVFSHDAEIGFEATASDPDGEIARVEFVVDGRLVGSDSLFPFEFSFMNSEPGEREVYARAIDLDGAQTESLRISYSVQVPPPTLGIDLVTPVDRNVFCPGSSVRFNAEISGPLDEIRSVEFFAGETLLGSVREAPFEFLWEEPFVGDFSVSARIVKVDNEVIPSRAASIAVSENCGDVLLIEAGASAESDALREYLFEMGLGATVIDQQQVFRETISSFQLVVVHVGVADSLSDDMIRLLAGLKRSGRPSDGLPVPIYFIGDRLATESNDMSGELQEMWLDLVGIETGGGGASGGGVEIFDTQGGFELLSGRFGELVPFQYELSLEDSLGTGDVDVLAFSGGSDLAVVHPPFSNFDDSVARTLTQNFFVVEGGDAESVLERKRFFQNSVCWLLRCSRCTNVDLGVQIVESPTETELGSPFEVSIRLVNNGACEATAAQVLALLPPSLRVNDVGFNQGLDWEFSAETGNLIIDLGRVGRGDPAAVEVQISLSSVLPGELDWELCSRSSNTVDACRNLGLSIEGILPPELFVRRVSDSEIELTLKADQGPRYSIQESSDLRAWSTMTSTSNPSWQGRVSVGVEGTQSRRFFRVAVGQ